MLEGTGGSTGVGAGGIQEDTLWSTVELTAYVGGGGSRRTWGGHLVNEPGYRRHGLGYPLGERGYLPLEVDKEGIRPLPTNDFDGAVKDMGLVEGHGASRAQGVGADIMRVESQPLEFNLAGGCTEVEDYVGSRDRFLCIPRGHIIGTNGCVGRAS